jgi:prevent-host-death family protein
VSRTQSAALIDFFLLICYNLANLSKLFRLYNLCRGETLADNPLPKTISATEASNHFGTMIDEAARGRSLFVVTRMGRPQAVVIGMDQYLELMELLETADELKDREYLVGIAEAREDIQLGRTLGLEELDREFGFSKAELGEKFK